MIDYKSDPFILHIELLRKDIPSWDHHPFSVPAINSLSQLALHPQVTFFVGENGTGKSTLLEAIAVALGMNAEGGSANFRFNTVRETSPLSRHIRIDRGRNLRRPRDGYFFRAESYFNVATEIDKLDDEDGGNAPKIINFYGGKSLHHQSHGESFFTLLTRRFGGDALYLFDEPEAALSPMRQMAMISAMHNLVKNGSQIIIATHSPILLAYPHAVIYQFSSAGISKIDYEQTEHYQIMHAFMMRPKKMIAELIKE